jgi:hypothetical protein
MFGTVALATCSAITITPTTSSPTLAAALGGGGLLTINSAIVLNGAASQFGTYTGFTSPPVTIGNGIVLSTGQVAQVLPAFNNGVAGTSTTPSTDLGQSGTPEFDAYGIGRITNFSSSNDVAKLQVNFTLSAASQVGFNFIFGSVEFPQFNINFTDAFVAFLDGTGAANQIVFDASDNPVQVGSTSFASALTTADTNTAFADPHGLLQLQTFTVAALAAGSHTLTFEIGDVNDGILDSAVFISDLRAGTGPGGTTPTAPEPASMVLLPGGILAVALLRRRIANLVSRQ